LFGIRGYEQVTAHFMFVKDRIIVTKVTQLSVKVLLASWPTDRFI